MRLIDADALYEKVQHEEELARNRVLDTESTLPYPNNLNPSYTRYVAQMNERTRLKFMIADAPAIEPERKGKWLGTAFDGYADGYPVYFEWQCSECGCVFEDEEPTYNFCPRCGADMREGGAE